jgi:hypothetical protein
MPTGYSRSPLLLKGALVEFSERFIGPVPNVIVFQYNPESLTRSLEVWDPSARDGAEATPGVPPAAAATAQPADPPETFSLALELDATDELETGDPVAVLTGVADRLAALEMLLYPEGDSLLDDLVGAVSSALGGGADAEPVPRGRVPVVLFVWGPGRIVPVRVTRFQVEEQAFLPTLYPIRAKATVGLKVLTPADFPAEGRTFAEDLAVVSFQFTRTQKRGLAAANLANSVDSILGMLPF